MRGRYPKPTALKVAEGNPGHRPINLAELLSPTELPKAPKWLSKRAKFEWRRIVRILEMRQLVREEDQIQLANLCEAIATLVEAREQLADMGYKKRLLVQIGGKVTEKVNAKGKVISRERQGGTVVVNPILYVIRDQIQAIARIAAEFGLSPVARARLNLTDQSAVGARRAADPLEALLGGGDESDASDPVVVQ